MSEPRGRSPSRRDAESCRFCGENALGEEDNLFDGLFLCDHCLEGDLDRSQRKEP